MSINTTNTAALIEPQIAPMLMDPLEAESVVLAANPTVFNSSEPLRIKKLVSGFTPAWVGEGELIPDAGEADFDELQLMPTERKSIKSIITITNEMIRQAKTGVQELLQQRLVRDIASALDTALLTGDGSDNTITGIINQPEITKATMDLEDTDSLLDALALAASKEVTPNRLILNGGDFFTLRKLKDGNGRYIMQSDLTGSAAYRLFDVPVTVTNKLPAGKAILANTKEIAVVRDQNPTMTILTERYAEYDKVGIRVTTRFDLGLLRPEGVILLETE
ncbi:phage major capsid protein [Corynebacterium gerontici]|uniref:Phage capsid family protein n=1 Tax=Corynebacterium gerontici TaxID=2079234 RepID=A0A3G6IZY8_9CORY|nr:phage major capsid protein [Corynebacterium gerontici]AZA11083.1 Phage capsid family protein [Corynebacterium gerontici]